MVRKNHGVAFLIIGIPELSGSGGAERFFADFFEIYNDQLAPKRKLIFLTDDPTNLESIGKLKQHNSKVFNIKINRTNSFTNLQWRFKKWKDVFLFLNEIPSCISIISILRKQNIKILHIPLYEDKDYYLLKLISLSIFFRPKIVINIVDCRIPYYYFKTEGEYSYANKKNYSRLFNNIKIDAIYCWYNLFKDFVNENALIRSSPPITVIKSRFTNTKFINEADLINKRNVIVFAGRLDEQKNPMFFLEALNIALKESDNLNDWKVEIYGKGALEEKIRNYISENDMSGIVSLGFTSDLPSVLYSSKCYASTQEFENFPSLAMAEAMANANLLISRNVGQTTYFVRDSKNGFLAKEDTPRGFADCILKLIKLSNDEILQISIESMNILKYEHTPERFILQTDNFWDSVTHKN